MHGGRNVPCVSSFCLITFLVVVVSNCSIVDASLGWSNCTEHFVNGLPPSQLNNSISICRGGYYALSWDPAMQNPSWSAYRISKENTSMKIAGRVSGFRKDPDLQALDIENPSTSNDAYSTLWNRGHVGPSAILSATYLSKYSTYYTSNIAPQWWQFNQQSWATLESRVFSWIDTTNRTLQIVTGVGYLNRSIAEKVDGVALPTWYWKAVCDVDAQESVAFIGNNSQDGGGMMGTYRSVEDVAETVFCGASENPGLNTTEPSAGSCTLSPFTIFPTSVCNTAKYNASHWDFEDYVDNGLKGANCSAELPADPTDVCSSFKGNKSGNTGSTSTSLSGGDFAFGSTSSGAASVVIISGGRQLCGAIPFLSSLFILLVSLST